MSALAALALGLPTVSASAQSAGIERDNGGQHDHGGNHPCIASPPRPPRRGGGNPTTAVR
jgi:hypothetical protein